MKKAGILFIMVLPLLFFLGCVTGNNGKNGQENPVPQSQGIKDYFPVRGNTRYIYEGKGNEYAAYDVYIDYYSENRVQQRINNGGTEMAKVLELKDGKLIQVLSRGEVYYRENLLQTQGDKEEILLMEPLVKGTTWTLKDSRVRTITGTSADITTPAGKFKAIEVTTEGPHDKIIDYYAKDVGLVKTVFISGDTEVTSTLSKIEEDVPLIQRVNFYYPNINDRKYYYKSREISFKTNDITRKALEAAYKEPVSNTGKVFSANTKINSLYLNKDNMVYIDLNQAFLTEMNAGTMYEGMILQSIANTFGQYYNAEKVILTIDGRLYESGHILMTKGEYLRADYKDAVEIE